MTKLCDCYWCRSAKKQHPVHHIQFHRVSDYLLKPDSLDPKDSIKVEECTTCGHKRIMT